jgi:hypothetical protein
MLVVYNISNLLHPCLLHVHCPFFKSFTEKLTLLFEGFGGEGFRKISTPALYLSAPGMTCVNLILMRLGYS